MQIEVSATLSVFDHTVPCTVVFWLLIKKLEGDFIALVQREVKEAREELLSRGLRGEVISRLEQ